MPPRKTRPEQVQNPAELQEQAQADILRRLAALREEKAQEAEERETAARERAEQKEQLDAVHSLLFRDFLLISMQESEPELRSKKAALGSCFDA